MKLLMVVAAVLFGIAVSSVARCEPPPTRVAVWDATRTVACICGDDVARCTPEAEAVLRQMTSEMDREIRRLRAEISLLRMVKRGGRQ